MFVLLQFVLDLAHIQNIAFFKYGKYHIYFIRTNKKISAACMASLICTYWGLTPPMTFLVKLPSNRLFFFFRVFSVSLRSWISRCKYIASIVDVNISLYSLFDLLLLLENWWIMRGFLTKRFCQSCRQYLLCCILVFFWLLKRILNSNSIVFM